MCLGRIYTSYLHCTKIKFSLKDFFSKCDQIRRKLQIWSHLLKQSLMKNFFFCVVLNIKKLLALSRYDIWNLLECNGNRSHNNIVRNQTLNHLAKWLSVLLHTNWLWVRFPLVTYNIIKCLRILLFYNAEDTVK